MTLAVVSACWSTPRPNAPSRETNITFAVEQVELANGLKVVIVPEPTATEVAVTVRYGAGTVDDPHGREGTAHVVEHMMFEHVRGDEALFDFLERRADGLSGFTTLDSTVYSEHAPPERLGELLELEQARLALPCAAIPDSSFVRQREIVRNELREREGDDRVRDALLAAVFTPGHPLAAPRETPASIAAITHDEACAFAAAHYAPNNAVVVVSGPVSVRDARAELERTLGAVARGTPAPSRALPAVSHPHTVTADAPVDRAWFLLAWPMPASSIDRVRLRAVASMAAALVGARVNGVVELTEIGTGMARQLAIAVAPSSEISFADALANTKDVLSRMGPWFGSGLYEHARSRALYRLVASLEHGLDRDASLADEVARGGNASAGSRDAMQALRTMSRDTASDVVRSSLDPGKATVVTLHPVVEQGQVVGTLQTSFRELRRRKAEDPAQARQPVTDAHAADPLARMQSTTLQNGLRVVLLPLSTMPAVEIRLVIPVGSGDEPVKQRGIATVAAQALQPAFDTTMFKFMQAGGRVDQEVGLDATELGVRGLAANLDVLLSGLATTVREGSYDLDDVRDVVEWHKLAPKEAAGERVAVAAWREAVFGSDHPYRHAGLWEHAERGAFDLAALEQFRARYYVPEGATLIIAGQFDPALARRWIDYYFKDWTGAPPPRSDRTAQLRPLAFGQSAQTAQLEVQIALPAPSSDDAVLQTAVEMIEEAISEVREQIAASYGLRVHLRRRRLLTTIEIDGFVDASRAGEALALLRDRLAKLPQPSDETASLFVSARRRVLGRIAGVDTDASNLADLVTRDVATGGVPAGTRPLQRIRTLTLDRMVPALEKLDLGRAAILLRGPERAVRDAYAAIGRTPSFLE